MKIWKSKTTYIVIFFLVTLAIIQLSTGLLFKPVISHDEYYEHISAASVKQRDIIASNLIENTKLRMSIFALESESYTGYYIGADVFIDNQNKGRGVWFAEGQKKEPKQIYNINDVAKSVTPNFINIEDSKIYIHPDNIEVKAITYYLSLD